MAMAQAGASKGSELDFQHSASPDSTLLGSDRRSTLAVLGDVSKVLQGKRLAGEGNK